MRSIIAERKRPRTDNEQTITTRSAYAGCNPGRVRVKPGLPQTASYQALQARFQPLRPLSGATVPREEFCTVTMSPISEPS